MHIRHLTAENFRNLQISLAELSPGINILYGDNAQGKTNFLEAVYFCALGRPLRADHCRELIPIGGQTAQARAVFSHFTIHAHVEQNRSKCVKSISLDRVPIKNTRELFGRVPIVSFSPEDLRLIKAGPAERRRFMDIEICQLSPVYYQELREYHRALRQRNHLLKTLQKEKNQLDSLCVWDAQLVQHGLKVMRTREKFVDRISSIARAIHGEITQGKEKLTLEYKPGVSDPESFATALDKHRQRDITLGSTSVGAHRDDVLFTLQGISARSFGSQGQQRTAALSVKLAEIELMGSRTGTSPILLLDDVFSELDAGRQAFLLSQVQDVQTLLTCTGLELTKGIKEHRIIHIKNGKIM
ncbi:MAG: DNA replication/repair protein RecF [Defluviitaleaceae bacterium]|nr:DNA replication/repair protein RecF [Defluviitaleaceae bacterium]MCL2239765.1 DNA replication/repair protein RecF [Defluviitaleaceae bacterium]